MIRLTRSERKRAFAYHRMIKKARARGKAASAPAHPSHLPRLRHGRLIDPVHKQAVAQLFCVATAVRTGLEVGGVHVAHVRYSSAQSGARNPGLQRKPDDCWTVPLSPLEHHRQHAIGERRYWAELGLDPHAVAEALHGASPDLDAMREALRQACRSGPLLPLKQSRDA